MLRLSACLLLVLASQSGSWTDESAALPDSCVAIGFGVWLPKTPWIYDSVAWAQVRHVRLSQAHSAWPQGEPWRKALPWPDSSPDVRLGPDLASRWLAPTPDSLLLHRGGGPTWSLTIEGTWRGDTLRARVHYWDDVHTPGDTTEPRANAYGIRHLCSQAAATAAVNALQPLLRADRPSPDLHRREAERERAGRTRWHGAGQPAP